MRSNFSLLHHPRTSQDAVGICLDIIGRLFFSMKLNASMKSVRIDTLLVSRCLFGSREKAKRAILAGEIQIEGVSHLKPGTLVSTDVAIKIKTRQRYVSRGGGKLEHALKHFSINVFGKVCMDVGSSTGGFTDCLIQHGAQLVYAIDVGFGQLHWSLRQHPRVISHEGINARYLQYPDIMDCMEIIVADVSFISLTLILPSMFKLLTTTGHMILLIKPQFELSRQQVGRGGIVREPMAHWEAIEKIRTFVTACFCAHWDGTVESPIAGRRGNKEFFACLHRA